jgi:CheY-like chemotaxis protein
MRKQSVLIVDDDAGAVQAFEPMLTAHGYHVATAGDAVVAFEQIERSVPDVMLVDLHLPNINGVEFLRRIRTIASRGEIPAAVITGDYLIDDQIVRDLETLNARIFFKPLWEEDLIKLVAELISTRRPTASSLRST